MKLKDLKNINGFNLFTYISPLFSCQHHQRLLPFVCSVLSIITYICHMHILLEAPNKHQNVQEKKNRNKFGCFVYLENIQMFINNKKYEKINTDWCSFYMMPWRHGRGLLEWVIWVTGIIEVQVKSITYLALTFDIMSRFISSAFEKARQLFHNVIIFF